MAPIHKDSEDDLQEKLKNSPHRADGFDEDLRRRINAKLDEQTQKRRRRFAFVKTVAAAAAMLTAVFIGYDFVSEHATRNNQHSELASAAPPAQMNAVPVTVNSALLIGLRTDPPAEAGPEAVSTYRTMLIAPEDGKLERTAEGEGILMPYKQDFWMVAPRLAVSGGAAFQMLTAVKAQDWALSAVRLEAAPAPERVANGEASERSMLNLEEKLLFIGNRYLAVSQKRQSGQDVEEYVWVKEIPQIDASKRRLTVALEEELHIPLREVLGAGAELAVPAYANKQPVSGGDSWAVQRAEGRWVAMQAVYFGTPRFRTYTLEAVPAALPDTVVNHDRLAASWEELLQLRPDLRDAYSSPTNDMMVLVDEDSLDIHPYGTAIEEDKGLSIPLSERETVIMAQWAAGKYVPIWKEQVKTWFEQFEAITK